MKPCGLKYTGYIAKKHLEIPHFLRKKLKSSEFFHATGYLQKKSFVHTMLAGFSRVSEYDFFVGTLQVLFYV